MAAKVVRQRVTDIAPAPMPRPAPEKRWDDLTAEEREALMKQIAEDRGYVKR